MDGATAHRPEQLGTAQPMEKLAGLIDKLTALTPIGRAAASHALVGPYQLRADKHCVQASNLYPLEYDDRGTCFRWSGPGELLRFHLSLSPAVEWRILLRFISTSDIRNPTDMDLFVDGTPILLSRTDHSGIWLLSSESFRVQARKVNEIVYNVPHLCSPRATDPLSADARRLGIAWHDLRIEPQNAGA
jgi:hypothetical protein